MLDDAEVVNQSHTLYIWFYFTEEKKYLLLCSSEFVSVYVQTNVILLPNGESKFCSGVVSSMLPCMGSGILSVQAEPTLVTSLCCFRQNCLRAVLLLLCQIPTISWVKLLSLTDLAVILCVKIKVVEGEAHNLKYWRRLSSSRRCWFFGVWAVEPGLWSERSDLLYLRPVAWDLPCFNVPHFHRALGIWAKWYSYEMLIMEDLRH